ncbi:MAG: MBL fold metallo-hydrolase [Planctomycetes bacterium]|nr:MBL fold metallo-hydrolase [Planctomycetota bacterium]
MRIGRWEVATLETGRFKLDGGAMFGVVPKALWEKSNPCDDRNRIDLAMRVLLLREVAPLATGGAGQPRVVLVDAGVGGKYAGAKFADIFGIDQTRCDLDGSLRAAGVQPGDVTHVVLSHGHFDHAGGATVEHRGRLVPAFSNARFFLQKANWETAEKPNLKERASYLPENLAPLREHGVLELVDGPGEILPGVELCVHHGHTAGQQQVRVHGPEGTLFFCADLVPTASHVPVNYVMAYDVAPLITMEEKARLMERAAAERWILVFEHDPAIPAGRVERTDKGFRLGEKVNLDVS